MFFLNLIFYNGVPFFPSYHQALGLLHFKNDYFSLLSNSCVAVINCSLTDIFFQLIQRLFRLG